MNNIRIEKWNREYSFNGVELKILQDNLPDPCLIVYIDDVPVGAEDGNIRTEEQLLEIYSSLVNKEEIHEETIEEKINRISKENDQLKEELALINYSLMMGGMM